jgi:hypothetical protein
MRPLRRPRPPRDAAPLGPDDVVPSRGGWAGLPPAADAVAFDGVGRLLAVRGEKEREGWDARGGGVFL